MGIAAKAGQCMIVAGPGVRLLWSTTEAGFPCVTIQPSSNNLEPSFEKDAAFPLEQASSWTYNEVPGKKSIVTFHTPDAPQVTYTPIDSDTESTLVSNDPSVQLQNIRQRINKRWPARREYLKSHTEEWETDPGAFYGVENGLSGLEYSLGCLLESAEGQDQDRCMMYKALLAREVDESVEAGQSIKPEYAEMLCRRALFDKLYKSLRRQKSEERDRRVFDYSILLGRAVNMLDSVNAAFSLTLLRILTQRQVLFLRDHLEKLPLQWIDEEDLSEINSFIPITIAIRDYLWQQTFFDFSDRPQKRLRTNTGEQGLSPRERLEVPEVLHAHGSRNQSAVAIATYAGPDEEYADGLLVATRRSTADSLLQPMHGSVLSEMTFTDDVQRSGHYMSSPRRVNAYVDATGVQQQHLEDFRFDQFGWNEPRFS